MKVIFISYPNGGHTYSMLGLAEILRQKGHDVIFHFFGSNEAIPANLSVKTLKIPGYVLKNMIKRFPVYNLYLSKNYSLSDFVRRLRFNLDKIVYFVSLIKYFLLKDKHLKELIQQISPDILIVDDLSFPSIVFSGKPWVRFWSANPKSDVIIYGLNKKGLSGKIVNSMCDFFIGIILKFLYSLRGYSIGCSHSLASPHLNLFNYPKEIDYELSQPNKYKIANVDAAFYNHTKINDTLDLSNLMNRDKKLILVSFGSLVSNDVKFMRKIVSILSKSDNNFIVSKGGNHDSYKLSRNMIGDKFINQKQIYPFIDLVISHGGNNTFTEAFYFGKPQIIIPIAGDQHSNAERISKFNLGKAINPTNLNEKILLDSIESILKDKNIKTRLSLISSRIQKENNINLAVKLIENLKTDS